jgi:hypothetical protein
MNDIQRELLNILERLDERQQEVLLFEARELERDKNLTRQQFLKYADASRAALREKHGSSTYFDSLNVLEQIRQEEDDELGG